MNSKIIQPKKKCCIKRCRNGKNLFKLRLNWINILQIKNSNGDKRVCNLHFARDQFTLNGEKLKADAVPVRSKLASITLLL